MPVALREDHGVRTCPVCGMCVLERFEICDNCDWQNDLYQLEHPDRGGGANKISLNEARVAYASGEPIR